MSAFNDDFIEIEQKPAPCYGIAVAKKPIDLEATLLTRKPLAAIPLEERKPTTCSRCLRRQKEEVAMIACSKCRCESYCSSSCKNLAWKEYHSSICQHLPSIYYGFQSTKKSSPDAHAGILLIRCVSIHLKEESPNLAALQAVRDLSLEQIRGRDNGFNDPELNIFAELIPGALSDEEVSLLEIIAPKLRWIERTSLEYLLKRFAGNNHVLTNERLESIGHAILPTLSRTCNHACASTGVASTFWDATENSIKVQVRPLRPLKVGEELTIPYLDAVLPLLERQTYLGERYGFECVCSLCTYQKSLPVNPNPPSRSKTPTTARNEEDLYKLFGTVIKPGVAESLPIVVYFTEKRPDQFHRLRIKLPSRVPQSKLSPAERDCLKPDVVRELTSIFSEGQSEGDWEEAVLVGMYILGIYVTVYGWRYPLVGLHLLDLAKVSFNSHMEKSMNGGDVKELNILRTATQYQKWARETLDCSVAMGGELSGDSPMEEMMELKEAIDGEWEFERQVGRLAAMTVSSQN